MPLFIDRLPFHYWEDRTRTPPLGYWTIVLPILLTEPNLPTPPAGMVPHEWVLDTGNRGEGYAWRHHLIQAELDPVQNRLAHPVAITAAVGGKTSVPARHADLLLVSNLGRWQTKRTVSPCNGACRFRTCRRFPIRKCNARW